ncbi:hypothetical protein, partial [Streptomyces formicae]
IAVPQAGYMALCALQEGLSVSEAQHRVREQTGESVDVAAFVGALADLGFVAAIDGQPVPGPPVPHASLAWIAPRHVRWTLHPATHVAVVVVLLGIAACTVSSGAGIDVSWRGFVWNGSGTVVLLSQAAVAWTLILIHELAHLCTARAVGVPGRFGFGTRLQFLAAQTDVSGIWAAPRRIRLTVYFAGFATDAVLCSLLVTSTLILGTSTFVSAAVLTALTLMATQFLIFMRTDLYFVLQDLTGCRDMYGDASRLLRHHLHRLAGRHTTNPVAAYRTQERHSLYAYLVVMPAGTLACLAVAALYTIPAVAHLMAGGIADIMSPARSLDVADGLGTCAILVGFYGIWARTWWTRHGARVTGTWRRLRTRAAP